jgi:hypothetical protein
MSVYAVAGAPGAPGATATALACLLAWPLRPGRRLLLVEADPDGGAIAAGYLRGQVDARWSLRNLAVAEREGRLAEAFAQQLLDLSPNPAEARLLIPGLTDPAHARALDALWPALAAHLTHLSAQQDTDILIDLGRRGGTGPSAPLLHHAEATLLVTRGTLRALSAAAARADTLRTTLSARGHGAATLGLLLIDTGPYRPAEAATHLRTDLLASLPEDRVTAAHLTDGARTRPAGGKLLRAAHAARRPVDQHRARPHPSPDPASFADATPLEAQRVR